jgi:hypothetical protein
MPLPTRFYPKVCTTARPGYCQLPRCDAFAGSIRIVNSRERAHIIPSKRPNTSISKASSGANSTVLGIVVPSLLAHFGSTLSSVLSRLDMTPFACPITTLTSGPCVTAPMERISAPSFNLAEHLIFRVFYLDVSVVAFCNDVFC